MQTSMQSFIQTFMQTSSMRTFMWVKFNVKFDSNFHANFRTKFLTSIHARANIQACKIHVKYFWCIWKVWIKLCMKIHKPWNCPLKCPELHMFILIMLNIMYTIIFLLYNYITLSMTKGWMDCSYVGCWMWPHWNSQGIGWSWCRYQ